MNMKLSDEKLSYLIDLYDVKWELNDHPNDYWVREALVELQAWRDRDKTSRIR